LYEPDISRIEQTAQEVVALRVLPRIAADPQLASAMQDTSGNQDQGRGLDTLSRHVGVECVENLKSRQIGRRVSGHRGPPKIVGYPTLSYAADRQTA
jgi:hypothetical protein